MKKALVVSAVVILILATFGVTFSHVALLPLGLAVYIASELVD